MLSRISVLALAILAAVAAGCSTPTAHHIAYDDELAVVRKKADAGDVIAAYRAFLICQFYTHQPDLALSYLRAAANGGHVPAMSLLGAMLLESKEEAERKAGVEFLTNAALGGDVDARKFLELRGVKW